VFYYLTLYNENYSMPALPSEVALPEPLGSLEEGIVAGLYPFRPARSPAEGEGNGRARRRNDRGDPARATILGSGSIMRQALAAQELLADRFGVLADVWSATSYQLLRNDALGVDHWNRLHPAEEQRIPLVTRLLRERGSIGPIVAASDYLKAVPDQIARWVPGPWRSLGTDGFGRSDTRPALRRFFGVDAETIAATVMAELARCGRLEPKVAASAVEQLGLDPKASHGLTA
jgi:pyruvate dehydrogenase E1 component